MTWFRIANANGQPAYINDAGITLAVGGTSPNFTVTYGTTSPPALGNGTTFSTAAAAAAALQSVVSLSREEVIDVGNLPSYN